MALKSIILYGHGPSPNPWKVAFVLAELGLHYEWKEVHNDEIKAEPYTLINPNGRLPAIEDPNTGITLWESGAIIEYLVETYDKEHKISFERGSKDYFVAKQWLHFQMSGQGPYFGQLAWFVRFHPEKIQSAIDRYTNEVRRVSGVLNGVLNDRQYLVDNRFSYVDLAFLPWFDTVPFFVAEIKFEEEYPQLHAWLESIRSRSGLGKVLQDRAASATAKAAAEAQK
ncbi:glutathione S-transferase [Aspergillus karnatakaensis]|uniref:glutathione S-transferase family protein n=1 Tax=Aspergillus karnatakaensis TaxID=1810916 RepID=UPI003CCD9EAF